MRFSDLKKIKIPAEPSARAVAERPEPAPPRAATVSKQPAPVPPQAAQPASPAPETPAAAQPKPKEQPPFAESRDRAREIYSRLMAQTDSFLKAVDQPYCEKYESVLSTVLLTVETLKTNPALLECTSRSTADDYLRAHTTNTFILALAMGLESGLDNRELNLLGFCALAHDMGMTGYVSIYNSPQLLDDGAFAELSLHAEAGAAKLDRIVDVDYKVKERARRIILQTHERPDGSGYPDRAGGEQLDRLAQIISIADAYEAMTHPRAWRAAMAPPAAIKEIIEKESRGPTAAAVKALVAVVSIYPPGSLVLLSTGEVARVLKVNRRLLSRPLAEVVLARDLSETAPRLVDLREQALVSIDRSLPFEEVEQMNPGYAGKLELSLWWTDW